MKVSTEEIENLGRTAVSKAFAYYWEITPHGQAEFSEHTQLDSQDEMCHASSCVDDALVSS